MNLLSLCMIIVAIAILLSKIDDVSVIILMVVIPMVIFVHHFAGYAFHKRLSQKQGKFISLSQCVRTSGKSVTQPRCDSPRFGNSWYLNLLVSNEFASNQA